MVDTCMERWTEGKWNHEVAFSGEGDYEELQSFMSQHRKSSVRGKMMDKKWFIRIGCLWGLQVGERGGAMPWELSGLQLYDQRKSGEREETTFFLILE